MLWFKKNPLDEEIDKVIESLAGLDKSSIEYTKRIEALGKLLEAKSKCSAWKQVDPNTIIAIIGSLTSSMLIITAERSDIVGRSKAWNERPKITVKPR